MKRLIIFFVVVIFTVGTIAQQPGRPILPVVKNQTMQEALSPQYEIENFRTVLSIIIHRGEDDMRNGQRLMPSVILTDGTVISLKQNDLPLFSHEIFAHEGGYVGFTYDRFAKQAKIGSINNIRFDGKPNRIHAIEVLFFEETRPPLAGEDNFDIDSVQIKYSVIDKKANRVIQSGTFNVSSQKHYRLTGSGVLFSHVFNPVLSYAKQLATEEFTPGIKFKLLNGADGMKVGYSMAKFLVEMKSGGVMEADITGATKGYSFLVQKTNVKIKWNDIRRIGIRYIYPSNLFDRDDWTLKGLAVEYDSFYKGSIRIYTNWNLNTTFNGDGQGTTWWSPVLNLNL